MARSIHDTWGVMARAKEADWSDADVSRAIVAETRRNAQRQQAVRESVRRLRRGGAPPPQPVDADTLPVLIDEAPYVFHPAGVEDVRAILRRLPPGSLDGLQAVRLCVDPYNDGGNDGGNGGGSGGGESPARDPFLGRRFSEVLPGLYASDVLGTYTRATATIRVHAYLCEPETVAPFALFFKMRALRTLVHEAAHHFDLTFRVGRGRWDLRDKEKKEAWADRSEEKAAFAIVLPYVQERYAAEWSELEGWIARHTGTSLPVAPFLEDERESELPHAFLALVRSVRTGADPDATRVTFARALHDGIGNQYAERVVRSVLGNRPDHPGALAVRACILQCGDRDFETAEILCQRALATDPACPEAWDVLVRGQAIQERWAGAADACERALAVIPAGDTEHVPYIVRTLVESRLLLGDFGQADLAISRMRARGTRYAELEADAYTLLARCWAERWEDALLLASRLQAIGKHREWRHWLAAARFECAHRLGRPHLAGGFDKAALARLERRYMCKEWARRIRAHVAMGAA